MKDVILWLIEDTFDFQKLQFLSQVEEGVLIETFEGKGKENTFRGDQTKLNLNLSIH